VSFRTLAGASNAPWFPGSFFLWSFAAPRLLCSLSRRLVPRCPYVFQLTDGPRRLQVGTGANFFLSVCLVPPPPTFFRSPHDEDQPFFFPSSDPSPLPFSTELSGVFFLRASDPSPSLSLNQDFSPALFAHLVVSSVTLGPSPSRLRILQRRRVLTDVGRLCRFLSFFFPFSFGGRGAGLSHAHLFTMLPPLLLPGYVSN